MSHQTFTDSNFKEQVLESKIPVVVDFWADWCPPCKIIAPHMDELANEYKGKVIIGKMNIDENQQVPGQYAIMSIPTIIIFKNGQPFHTLVGARGKKAYQSEIDKALSSL
jgi:thioredoxin 1